MAKNISKFAGYTVMVLGIIGSIVVAKVFGSSVDRFGYVDRDWGLTIGIFIGGLLSTLCTSGILLGIGAMLEYLETITHKLNDVTTSQNKRHRTQRQEYEPKDGEWKCAACGKINAPYVGTCGCGHNK